MDVFFKLPVTDEGNYNINARNIVTVEQTANTTTAITYKEGVILTLTHADDGGTFAIRDEIYAAMKAALKQNWRQVNITTMTPSYAVSAVAATHVVVPVV